MTLAITIVGAVALLSGVLIYRRRGDDQISAGLRGSHLRTLGASTRMIGTMLAVGYGGLGLLAGAIGAAGALGLSWAICRHVLDIPWRPAPGIAAIGAVATTALVGVVGRCRELRRAAAQTVEHIEGRIMIHEISATTCRPSSSR